MVHELDRYAKSLDQLGITYQTNYARPERPERAEVAYLAIYAAHDQRRLLESVEDDLVEWSRKKLEDLVRARGPIPEEVLRRMVVTIEAGKSYEYLAQRLNELDIVAGMGGNRWTPKKAKQAVANA
jgi:hypothetical protein